MSDAEFPDLTELYGEFISENREILEKLCKELVSLEKTPHDETVINTLFRLAHTLKGNAGFIDFSPLGGLAHKAENILERLREKTLLFSPAVNDLFFRIMDMASLLLDDFEYGLEESRDLTSLEAEIDALLSGSAPRSLSEGEPGKDKVDDKERSTREEAREGAFMRVSTLRLDSMVNLVGELAARRSRLLQISHQLNNEALADIASSINVLSTQLQDEVLGIRMVPIKDLFNRFFRLVRDTARSLGKEAQLIVAGEGTELDKSVMELIYDPLVHLVRNSIDHGLEEDREKAGKGRIGTITLSACHEHNHVIIRVGDDGRGLKESEIRKRALERGLLSEEAIHDLTSDDLAKLVLSTGFSTAEAVSDISGRGVGMDVVKANIEKAGGDIALQWEEGKGTTAIIRVPLTLAIVQLFLVRQGRHIFGIPLHHVDETIIIGSKALETMNGQTVYMLRHKALPVLKMEDILHVSEKEPSHEAMDCYNVLVLGQMHMKAGIIVDEFIGKVDAVIKPLGPFIERLATPVRGVAGASILGSGEIALILDIPAIWEMLASGNGVKKRA